MSSLKNSRFFWILLFTNIFTKNNDEKSEDNDLKDEFHLLESLIDWEFLILVLVLVFRDEDLDESMTMDDLQGLGIDVFGKRDAVADGLEVGSVVAVDLLLALEEELAVVVTDLEVLAFEAFSGKGDLEAFFLLRTIVLLFEVELLEIVDHLEVGTEVTSFMKRKFILAVGRSPWSMSMVSVMVVWGPWPWPMSSVVSSTSMSSVSAVSSMSSTAMRAVASTTMSSMASSSVAATTMAI